MSWFSQNFTENPLLVEARRFWRKFVGASKSKTTNKALIFLLAVIYLSIVGIAFANMNSLTAEHITLFQSFLFCFIVPAVTFGAIAGERERRSWDMLMVAPISKTQIILGKFLSAISVVLAVAVGLLPIVIICSFGKENYAPHDQLWGVLASETASIGFGIAFAALGIFISSLMNRAFSAQATIYAILFVWMILWPMLVAIIPTLGNESNSGEYLLWTHPFMTAFYVMSIENPAPYLGGGPHHAGRMYTAPMQLLFYGSLTLMFLLLAIASIRERRNSLAGKMNNA
ncbi:MAG TPA: ABC transporter permease subunit [Fimbriimonadaceae bacterium]|jgi:ABC-type transport system involved in multi-copper enzyme maturation permease subunit